MKNASVNDAPVLVLGGNGKTGRRVAERLRAMNRTVRIGSRAASTGFDWCDPNTWKSALSGVHSVYVSYQPDLATPGALETVQAFFALAVSCGVKQMVLLSGRGEIEATHAERALQATETDWTILRSSWFSQNFSESFFLEPILKGEIALPTAAVAEPFVDIEDIADVAVTALTDGTHSGQLYELSGPRALSFPDAISEIAFATGRDLKFISVTPEQYQEALREAHVPIPMIDLIIYLFTTVLDGRNTQVADGVERALGRPPRDFTEYVKRTAATGVWGTRV